jgi:hypothetical protein
MDFENIKLIIAVLFLVGCVVVIYLRKGKEKAEGYNKDFTKKAWGDFDKQVEDQFKKHLADLKIAGFDVENRNVQARAFREICLGENTADISLYPRPSKYAVYPWEKITKEEIEHIFLSNDSLVKATRAFQTFDGESEGVKEIKKYVALIKADRFDEMPKLNDLFKNYVYEVFKDGDLDRLQFILGSLQFSDLKLWVEMYEAVDRHRKIIELKQLTDEKSQFTLEHSKVNAQVFAALRNHQQNREREGK